MRKIIQICSLPSHPTLNNSVFAVCDDGTFWIFDVFNNCWDRLPDIPQGNTEIKESIWG